MELVLTAEWIIVIIVLVLLFICGQLWLVARRSRSVVVPETKSAEPPEPPEPPPPIPSDPPNAPPAFLRRIPPRPEPLESPFGPCDFVPKAPNPAHLRPAEAQIERSTKTRSRSISSTSNTGISISGISISGISTSASSSAQRSLYRDPQEVKKQHTRAAAQPKFCALQVTVGPANRKALPRTLPLGPRLHPRQPSNTGKPVQLETRSSAWRQTLPPRPALHFDELGPQTPLQRPRQQCGEMRPELWHPSPPCPSPVDPVEVKAHYREPRTPCGPEPCLNQPRLWLMHTSQTSQKPMSPRALQTAESLPKPTEMSQRWKPPQQFPAQLREPGLRCPVFGARPRPLRLVEVPALAVQKLNQCLPLDEVTVNSSVQPGPMIWTCSSVKEPSMCTSIQLRKPENPIWPTSGNPHCPKRPETEPGFPKSLAHSAKIKLASVASDDEEAAVSEQKAPSPKKVKTVRGATGPVRPQTRKAKIKLPSVASDDEEEAASEQKAPSPKKVKVKTVRGATGPVRQQKRSASTGRFQGTSERTGLQTQKRRSSNSFHLDSTLGGPAHMWNRGSRHTAEETPGPGDYSPKHPGIHSRKF